ncbi:MAG: roadblock/LC7 domain-containing protein [Gemmatimonadetes bacterium]|nr:roadblock/LC7 domain-containing protein [Gemmatimonadota bacterium]MCC7131297.1 roadblock/LC7 domain-containing protein [Gemmatimonadales bacterium]
MPFTDLLDRWSSRPVIRGAAVVSEDGLLVHDALAGAVDREAIAALAVTVRRHAEQLGAAASAGDLGRVVVEFAGGPAILAALDDRHTLVVLAAPDRDLGPLLFDIRDGRSALRQAI